MFNECHAHIFMDSINYKNSFNRHLVKIDKNLIYKNFNMYKTNKINFIRDGGDNLGVSEFAKKISIKYKIDYRTPIFAIYHNGYYGKIIGKSYNNIKEYKNLVNEVKLRGGDFIKIITSGIMNFNTNGEITGKFLPYDEVKEIIYIAHCEGFSVMCHANGDIPVSYLIKAGADSIEHGNYISYNTLRMMSKYDVIWVPTISVILNLLSNKNFSNKLLYKIYKYNKNVIKKGFELGVNIALGSDSGAYSVFHGNGLLNELKYFKKYIKNKNLYMNILNSEKKIKEKFKTC